MVGRWGLGPVFANEWLTGSRRWQSYAGRGVFVGVLLLGLASVWMGRVQTTTLPPIQAMAEIGRGFYNTIVFTQLTLVFLAAPAATAGAICQDKASGTLAQMLITDLSGAEIVLGKLAARLVPVFGLVCCTLPVLALATLLGGIDPLALTCVFLITLSVATFGCCLALFLSIWGSKPYEVLLATYAFFAIWLLALPVTGFLRFLWSYPRLPNWTTVFNPYELAVGPFVETGMYQLLYSIALASTLVLISVALVAVGINRLRRVIVGQADTQAARRSGLLAPLHRLWPFFGLGVLRLLDRNPVLWYETHRQRPTVWIRNLLRLYFVFALAFTLLAIDDALWLRLPNRGWLPAYVNAFEVAISLILVLLAATTALVEERARGNLDILLATPISSRRIVLTKWWAAYRQVALILPLPALLAAVTAGVNGTWLAAALLVAAILLSAVFWTSLGLALSTSVPRLGRAISLSTSLYVIVGLGWPILAETLFQNDWALATGLATISPFHLAFDLTLSIEQPRYLERDLSWILGSMMVQGILGLALLAATLATFDRSIGRIRG